MRLIRTFLYPLAGLFGLLLALLLILLGKAAMLYLIIQMFGGIR